MRDKRTNNNEFNRRYKSDFCLADSSSSSRRYTMAVDPDDAMMYVDGGGGGISNHQKSLRFWDQSLGDLSRPPPPEATNSRLLISNGRLGKSLGDLRAGAVRENNKRNHYNKQQNRRSFGFVGVEINNNRNGFGSGGSNNNSSSDYG